MGSNNPQVAIIGAGLTGLLVAQGLTKNGFSVTVFDSEAHIDERSRDWTIVLHWALPIMQELLPKDLLARLPEAICNPYLAFDESAESFVVYNGVTGDVLLRSPMPGSRRVSRQRMRRVLATGIAVQWGKKLTGINAPGDSPEAVDGPLQLTFADGSAFVADYVLGTDGAGSRVRELLLGAEAARVTRSGFMFATAITQYHDANKVDTVVKTHPVASACFGRGVVGGCGVLDVHGKPDDTTDWSVFWIKIWPGSMDSMHGDAALEYIKTQTPSLGEPWQSQIEWTQPLSNATGSICSIDEMKYWVSVPFDNRGGRVTLAGDAAHPMLVYRGQGFQHAITDASKYVEALVTIREAGWAAQVRKKAMADYGAEMVPRGATAVQQSVQEASLSLKPESLDKMLMARKGHGRSA